MKKLSLCLLATVACAVSACAEYDRHPGERNSAGYDRYEERHDRQTFNDPINCPISQARQNRCYHPWYSHRDPHNPDDRWMELSEGRDGREYRDRDDRYHYTR